MGVTVLHLVRHGQSEWNETHRLQGQADAVPLTALGLRQAEDAARALAAGRSPASMPATCCGRARPRP